MVVILYYYVNFIIMYISRNEEGRGLHSIQHVENANDANLKSYVSREAQSDCLMAKCEGRITNWKLLDEETTWYGRPLQEARHRGMSELADEVKTY